MGVKLRIFKVVDGQFENIEAKNLENYKEFFKYYNPSLKILRIEIVLDGNKKKIVKNYKLN